MADSVEWDEAKARANVANHGVSFEEAASLLDNAHLIVAEDPDHSYNEERFLMMAISNGGRLLVCSFTERGNTTRIISARRANPSEEDFYDGTWRRR